jgi:hypothetical protein
MNNPELRTCPIQESGAKTFAEIDPVAYQEYVMALLLMEDESPYEIPDVKTAFSCSEGHSCKKRGGCQSSGICNEVGTARKETIEAIYHLENFEEWLLGQDPNAFGIVGGSFQWKKWRPEISTKSDLDILLVVDDPEICKRIDGVNIEHTEKALELLSSGQVDMVKFKIPWPKGKKGPDVLSLHVVSKDLAEKINSQEFLESKQPLRCVRESKTDKTHYGPQKVISTGEEVMIPLNQVVIDELFVSDQLFFTGEGNSLAIGSLLDMIMSGGGKSFGNRNNAGSWMEEFTEKALKIIHQQKIGEGFSLPELFSRAQRMPELYKKWLQEKYDRE